MFNTLFNTSGFTLDRLRQFCEVADAGSITTAVEQYGRSQPTYSRTIAALEGFVGGQLFIQKGRSRSGKRFKGLTPRGEALRKLAIEFFEDMTGLLNYDEVPARIRFGAGETVLQWVICAQLPAIRAIDPDVPVHLKSLSSKEIIEQIERGLLDIGIVENSALTSLPDDLTSLDLGEIEYALFLNEEMLERSRTLSEKELLHTLPLAGLEGLGSTLAKQQSIAKSKGFELNFSVLVSSFPQMTSALRSGDLAGFLPVAAEGEMNQLNLAKADLPSLENLSVPISLIWNQQQANLQPFIATAASRIHTLLGG